MSPREVNLLEWLLLALGAGLSFSGWRAIARRRTRADGSEYEGCAAARLGWFWLALGILLILAAALDIAFLKVLGRLFLESGT
ncbi:MAG TPA: hypothetical protein PK919_09815 [Candidatus Aminicenantes bacterium]|nr:hypothetical protein [Candidatus Aminicenantes bacterium]